MSLFFSLYDHHYYSYGATKISGDSADLLLLCRLSSTHWAAVSSLNLWAALAIRPATVSGAATKWNSCWSHTRNILSIFTDKSCCATKTFPDSFILTNSLRLDLSRLSVSCRDGSMRLIRVLSSLLWATAKQMCQLISPSNIYHWSLCLQLCGCFKHGQLLCHQGEQLSRSWTSHLHSIALVTHHTMVQRSRFAILTSSPKKAKHTKTVRVVRAQRLFNMMCHRAVAENQDLCVRVDFALTFLSDSLI